MSTTSKKATSLETLYSDNDVYWVEKEDGYCIDIEIVKDHGTLTTKYPGAAWATRFMGTTRVVELDAASYKRVEAVCKTKCIHAPAAKKGERFVMVQCKRDVLPGNRQFVLVPHRSRDGEYNLQHLMHNDNDYFSESDEEGNDAPLDVEEEEVEEEEVEKKEVEKKEVAAAVDTLAPASPQTPTDGKKSFAAIVASVSAVEEFPPLPASPASTSTVSSPVVEKKGGRSKEEIVAELKALKQREVELLLELVNA